MVANRLSSRLPSFVALNPLSREFDEIVERVFGTPAKSGTPNAHSIPLSAWEENDQIHMQFDLPGFPRESLEVSLHDGVLKVAGERKGPSEEVKGLRNERYWGRFERTLTVPDTLDPERIEASYTDGVLHITLYKKPETQPRKIEIKGS